MHPLSLCNARRRRARALPSSPPGDSTGLLPWHFGGVKAAKGLEADEEGVSVGHVVGLDGIALFVPFVGFSDGVIQVTRG